MNFFSIKATSWKNQSLNIVLCYIGVQFSFFGGHAKIHSSNVTLLISCLMHLKIHSKMRSYSDLILSNLKVLSEGKHLHIQKAFQ